MKTKVCIHHSVLPLSTPNQWDIILHSHKKRGFGDNTAYHFFVEADGKIREGRPLTESSSGTQNAAVNASHIHICLAGNFETEHPTEAQINVLKRMLAARNITEVIGHRDAAASLCPGRNLYSLISTLLNDNITLAKRIWVAADTLKKQVGAFQEEMEEIQESAHQIANNERN